MKRIYVLGKNARKNQTELFDNKDFRVTESAYYLLDKFEQKHVITNCWDKQLDENFIQAEIFPGVTITSETLEKMIEDARELYDTEIIDVFGMI